MTNKKVSVIFIIYNRPDLAQQVLDSIATYRPERLYVVADGPKTPQDEKLCKQTRKIIDTIDWPCEVHKNYAEENMGCGKRVSSGITWAFETCDKAIILEDDCMPDQSFFPFCEELLEMYKDDTRIGMISGNNHGYNLYDPGLSYSFSKHGKIWGWATWRRAWKHFDLSLKFLGNDNEHLIKANISNDVSFVSQWWKGVDSFLHGELDTWGYQWGVSRYANNLLTIRPKVNLVANIGFGGNATHTKGTPKNIFSTTTSIKFPLCHPKIIIPDTYADRQLERTGGRKKNYKTFIYLIVRYLNKCRKLTKSVLKGS
jgi:glycosyltransferase involved in cell wall biosynthesis